MDRNVGIILTIASTLICGACSIFFCLAGILAGIFRNYIIITNNGVSGPLPPSGAYLLIAFAVLLILVPIVVGVFALRSRPTPPSVPPTYPPDQPLPPAI